MQKKIKLTIVSILFIILNYPLLASDELKIVPVKKPLLTDSELKKKNVNQYIKTTTKT